MMTCRDIANAAGDVLRAQKGNGARTQGVEHDVD
jgi:hypothetical protein